MKKLIGLLVALLCFAAVSLNAKDVHVDGYTRKDGTYVAPYTRTAPNKTNFVKEGKGVAWKQEKSH